MLLLTWLFIVGCSSMDCFRGLCLVCVLDASLLNLFACRLCYVLFCRGFSCVCLVNVVCMVWDLIWLGFSGIGLIYWIFD